MTLQSQAVAKCKLCRLPRSPAHTKTEMRKRPSRHHNASEIKQCTSLIPDVEYCRQAIKDNSKCRHHGKGKDRQDEQNIGTIRNTGASHSGVWRDCRKNEGILVVGWTSATSPSWRRTVAIIGTAISWITKKIPRPAACCCSALLPAEETIVHAAI